MGFFDVIKDAAFTANENAHGDRLVREFMDSLKKMKNMPRDNSDEIIRRYVLKRSKLEPAIGNWTRNGFLRMAQTLKDEARRVTDLNIIEGYALWMTSVWLESSVRKSEKAAGIFNQLDELAKAHESASNDMSDHRNDDRPTSKQEGKKVLLDAIRKILSCTMIEPIGASHPPDHCVKMDNLSWKEQMTLAAGIGGVAGSVAMEFGIDLYETFGIAAGMLELYGMSKSISIEGMATGTREYNPNPTTHFGITTWRGVEAMRKFRQGIDNELNCIYIVQWIFDGEY